METNLPTPMTARVELLIYQRVIYIYYIILYNPLSSFLLKLFVFFDFDQQLGVAKGFMFRVGYIW